jgi:hypothetical protein
MIISKNIKNIRRFSYLLVAVAVPYEVQAT